MMKQATKTEIIPQPRQKYNIRTKKKKKKEKKKEEKRRVRRTEKRVPREEIEDEPGETASI